MKKVVFTFLLCLQIAHLVAQLETPTRQLLPAQLVRGATSTVFDNRSFLAAGTLRPATERVAFQLKSARAVLTLFTNPYLTQPFNGAYRVQLVYTLQIFSPSGTRRDLSNQRLSIDYNPAEGSDYKAKDSYVATDVAWSSLRIDSVRITDPAGNAISLDRPQPLFYLRHQLQLERYDVPVLTEAPQPLREAGWCYNLNLLFRWRPLAWAEYYDLEWTYVDDYRFNPPGQKPFSALRYQFRHNNTRVRVKATEYEIPTVFERGYVVFRVRAVARAGAGIKQIVTGRWSMPDEGSLPNPASDFGVLAIDRGYERDKMNWQYMAAFNEGGKRKDLVQFADGTGRIRQTQTNLSTDRKVGIGETIYDHAGRPAINMLSAPVSRQYGGCPANESPALIFVSQFNQNPDKTAYAWRDFEARGPDSCGLLVRPAQSGAAQYFGENNPDKTGHQAYTPDAEGYPFIHTQYTSDNTGRILRQGAPGKDFQLGTGHERRYFYGAPTQTELDKIFGNDIGFARHYEKEAMLDENGQMSVLYKDQGGQIIASALTGRTPDNLDALERPAPASITIDLIEADNRREIASNALVATRQIIISQPTTANFFYRLTPQSFRPTCPLNPNLCYDCVYDLQLRVTDDCGRNALSITQTIGSLSNLTTCEVSPAFEHAQNVALAPGAYTITKRLMVNAGALNRYVADYLNQPCITGLREEWERNARAGIDPTLCDPPCNPCKTIPAGTTLEREITLDDGTVRRVSFPPMLRESAVGGCLPVCIGNATTSPCQSALMMLRADLSPGGQYAQYIDSTRLTDPLGPVYPEAFPLSILNPRNNLPLNRASRSIPGTWRFPLPEYQNADGSTAYVEIVLDAVGRETPSYTGPSVILNGKKFVRPQQLNRLQDFTERWQDVWADALLPYHPEYGYYLWCVNNENSQSYDLQMLNTDTRVDAEANNLTRHREQALGNDPFFAARPEARTDMLDKLNKVLVFRSVDGTREFNINQATVIFFHCQNLNYNRLAQVNACFGERNLYSSGYDDDEWRTYRGVYLSTKQTVVDVLRERQIATTGFFSNRFIGKPAGDLYYRKVKRFPAASDTPPFYDELGRPAFDNPSDFAAYHRARQRLTCNICPVGKDLESLFGALAVRNSLTRSVVLPGPGLSLAAGLLTQFPVPNALRYEWVPTLSGSALSAEIKTGGVTQCKFNLNMVTPGYKWQSLRYFSCIRAIDNTHFTLTAYTEDDRPIAINGEGDCLKLLDCSISLKGVCLKTPLSNDLAFFFNNLFSSGNYRSTAAVVHRAGDPRSQFPASLAAQHPAGVTWTWRYQRGDTRKFDANMDISAALQAFSCQFRLEIIDPGFTWADVFRIVELTGGTENGFSGILVAITRDGRRFRIDVEKNTCYRLYNCGNGIVTNNTPGSGVTCCVPIFPREIPVQRPCVDLLGEAAAGNARRRYILYVDRLRDSIGTAYSNHCLSAAEQFRAQYTEDIYQYTLYYYDRAGNLIKTVPPKGVRFLDAAQIAQADTYRRARSGLPQAPAHRMASTYTYNTLNAVLSKISPDGGLVKNTYDELGRIVLTQDAQQRAENACTFLRYDAHGRILETGRLSTGSRELPAKIAYQTQFASSWYTPGTKTEVARSIYDKPISAAVSAHFEEGQQYLRNRPASILYFENGSAVAYDYATHYSYDVHGNLTALVQEYPRLAALLPALASGGHAVKKMRYQYDLLSGRMKREIYQPGAEDQFVHWFEHDADNRLVRVKTSINPYEDEAVKDVDAAYRYYQHGPLARMTLGKEQVQGLDYAYTIQGWLKGINSGTLTPARDIGKDALATGLLPPDVFGYTLGYYSGDFKAVGRTAMGTGNLFEAQTVGSNLESGFSSPLYNGNIRHATLSLTNLAAGNIQNTAYRYDQLQRLKRSSVFRSAEVLASNQWSTGSFLSDFGMELNYDPNGNINTLVRRHAGGILMDDLSFRNASEDQSRLVYVDDRVAASTFGEDVDDQSEGNYQYDADGKLISDRAGNISAIQWNNRDRMRRFTKSGRNIDFEYDALGFRSAKITADSAWFFVRDAVGNILSIYIVKSTGLLWQETPLYAGSIVGSYRPEKLLRNVPGTGNTLQFRGHKAYELSNQTGDILTTVSDRKIPQTGRWNADVRQVQDYYPFGMAISGRGLVREKYTFGFQGMEKENALFGEGNGYFTENRVYDARLGRWLSPDPYAGDTLSNIYVGFNGNPVLIVDPTGGTIFTVNRDGTYADVDREATLSGDRHGIRMVNEEGGTVYELAFNDQEGDVARMDEFLRNVVLNDAVDGGENTPIVHVVSQRQGRQILTTALANRSEYELGLSYAWRESGGPNSEGSRLDFIRVLPGNEYSFPDGGPFYIFEGARTGRTFNFKDAGNFLWGAASRALMGSDNASVGAHVNNFIGWAGGVGNPTPWDDPYDQIAILLGRTYMERLFPSLPIPGYCLLVRCHD